MRVHLCGVRGSTPAPGPDFVRYGGHTSCLAVAHDDASVPTLILDTGTGVRQVSALMDGAPFTGTILYTHLHWDHFQGLPFFGAADREDARVSVFVPEGDARAGALTILERAMSPPHFPITPAQLRGGWTFATLGAGEHEHEGFTVLAREIPHKGGRTFGYRVSDGHSTLAYLPDHAPTQLGLGDDGWGAYHAAAIELAAGADALIHDAVMLPEELDVNVEQVHAVADYAVELGRRAQARAVVLFHHAPSRTDEQLDALGERLREAIVAREGDVLALPLPDR